MKIQALYRNTQTFETLVYPIGLAYFETYRVNPIGFRD
jgi:hypothetical protein